MTTIQGETRLLIDGKLVEASTGRTFANVNPATEDVLGEVADAGADDMDAAIAAARRAFDETDWSTNHKFRQQCLFQLQAALEAEREELRAELVAEVGAPVLLTYGPQLDAPLSDAIKWPAEFIDRFEWERDLPTGTAFGQQSWRKVYKEAAGVVAAIVPWNYPFEVSLNKLGPAWPPATPSSSRPPPTPRGTPPASAGWSPSRPTSRPGCSRSSPPRTTRWPSSWW